MWFWAKKKGSSGTVGKPFASGMRTMQEVKEKGEEDDAQRLITGSAPSPESGKVVGTGIGQEMGSLGLEGYIARMEKATDIKCVPLCVAAIVLERIFFDCFLLTTGSMRLLNANISTSTDTSKTWVYVKQILFLLMMLPEC